MYNEGKHFDITIKTADGNEIKANKFILAQSPVFAAMLYNHDTKEAKEGVIEIADISQESLNEMIRYMYTDEIPNLKELAIDLLYAGNKYDLPRLVKKAEEYLMSNVTIKNFGAISIAADQLNIVELQNAVVNFIVENQDFILTTTDWTSFQENNLELAIEIMKKCFRANKN